MRAVLYRSERKISRPLIHYIKSQVVPKFKLRVVSFWFREAPATEERPVGLARVN